MTYANLRFRKPKNRPFFYTNFVQTIDGKIHVKKRSNAYWPIGSKTDYQTLLQLRVYADVLIHGKHTALWTKTIDNLAKPEFQEKRKLRGKKEDLLYLVVSAHPDENLINILHPPRVGVRPCLVTTKDASIAKNLLRTLQIVRLGYGKVSINNLIRWLQERGAAYVLVEGGPTLLASFLSIDAIDELFVTIAPKILGNKANATLTMVENYLFPPHHIKQWKLISMTQVKNEVYLRYRIVRSNHS